MVKERDAQVDKYLWLNSYKGLFFHLKSAWFLKHSILHIYE